ncbi:MAG: hypothetical protein HY951_08385 [Bacteroidia bacterium]|nr:hypothetical protein [Bacteroidia bacterium]
MLEFSKTILEKVSFSEYLFAKELRKLIIYLGDDNESIKELQQWSYENYGRQFPSVFTKVFNA